MDIFETFLQTSSINGVNHIARGGCCSRLFWIFVVTCGFTVAGILINQSFRSWAESPIRTTIETKPITQLTLPTLTVCPPNNKFTFQNVDHMNLEGILLNNQTKEDLTFYAFDQFQEAFYKELWTNMSKLEEENKFYNWYHGFSEIRFPFMDNSGMNLVEQTSAAAGSMKTQYFGDNYDPEKIDLQLYYWMSIVVPDHILNNTDYVLTLEMEKLTMDVALNKVSGDNEDKFFAATPKKSKDEVWIQGYGNLAVDQNFVVYNHNHTAKYIKYFNIKLERKVTKGDVDENKIMGKMPGFHFKWYYNKEMNPVAEFNDDKCKEFRRFANILHNNPDNGALWNLVRKARYNFIMNSGFSTSILLKTTDLRNNIQFIEKAIGIELKEEDYNPVENISNETLESAAKMFIYLFTWSDSHMEHFFLMKDLFKNKSPRMMALVTSRLVVQSQKMNHAYKNIFLKIYEELEDKLDLKMKKISSFTDETCEECNEAEKIMKEETLTKIVNHPVHIVDEIGNFNPSSFIPFCKIGMGNQNSTTKVHGIDFEVCNIFKERNFHDQICYEVDPNNFLNNEQRESDVKVGIFLVIDTNEDKQDFELLGDVMDDDGDPLNKAMTLDQENGPLVYLNTIGKSENPYIYNNSKFQIH